ncbi:MAG: hypothetical protein Tsb0016_22720 [Sphingomonadales bacterium]
MPIWHWAAYANRAKAGTASRLCGKKALKTKTPDRQAGGFVEAIGLRSTRRVALDLEFPHVVKAALLVLDEP